MSMWENDLERAESTIISLKTQCNKLQSEIDELLSALKRSHSCSTIRADGTCDGCFVSEIVYRYNYWERLRNPKHTQISGKQR